MTKNKNKTRSGKNRSNAPAGGKLSRNHPKHSPGFTARLHRCRDAVIDLLHDELKRNLLRTKPLSMNQLKVLAAAQLQALQSNFRGLLGQYEKLAGTSKSPRRYLVQEWVECRAALAQPEMVWLRQYTTDAMKARRSGRPAKRGKAWAILVMAACLRGSKDLNELYARVEDPGKMQSWALGEPDGPELSGIYDSLTSTCGRHDVSAAWHANVGMLERMSQLRDKRGRLLHPDLCVYVVSDGTTVEGDIPQRPYKNGHHRAQVNGKARSRMAFLVYTDSKGRVTKVVGGYKLILLCCIKSTLPIIGRLYPATYDERKATLELVEELREIWPECPISYLVGDALFDRSKKLAYELEFTHGIHPVFVDYPVFSTKQDHFETKGTPECKHGHMHRAKSYYVYDTKWRTRHGQPLTASVANGEVMDAGKPATDNAHIVWTCDKGCESVKTYFRDDIRLYQFLPRSGDSDAAALRRALLLRQNAIESCNSGLKYLGLGAGAQGRIKWGGDVEVEWVLTLACAYMTARRLAHESGDYQRAYQTAVGAGLTKKPTGPSGTASPKPCRTDAVSAGALGDGITVTPELSLISWGRAQETEAVDEPVNLEDWRSVRENPEARQALIALGKLDLPLPGELEWEPDDADDLTDDEVIRLLGGEAYEPMDADAPLAAKGMNEKEYLEAHGEFDVSDVLGSFSFGVDNDADAVELLQELGVDEDLLNSALDEAESPSSDEAEAAA